MSEIDAKEDVLVSVIMPVYNAGVYLKEAVRDVLHQSYKNLELICVDDGSTDNSTNVLEFFAKMDSRIRIIRTLNHGAGAARNIGLNEAKGKYLFFLDADDRFGKDMIQCCVEVAEGSHANMVVFDGKCMDNESGWLYGNLLGNNVKGMKVFSHKDCPNTALTDLCSVVWNKMYNTEFVRRSEIYFQNTPYMNDVYFSQVLNALCMAIVVLDKVFVYYRVGGEETVSGLSHKIENPQYIFDVVEAIYRKLLERGVYESIWKSFANLSMSLMYSQFDAIDEKNYHIFKEKLSLEYIRKYRWDQLDKSECLWDFVYDAMQCLINDGFVPYICYLLHEKTVYIKNVQNRDLTLKGGGLDSDVFFDLGIEADNCKIVLYGAGVRGQTIFEKNINLNKYNIVSWVDQRSDEIESIFGVPINNPAVLQKLEFDYVYIAVDNVDIVKDIKKFLLNFVDEKKIIW